MLAKAPALGADQFVIDLEDAVAPTRKDAARAAVASALTGAQWEVAPAAVRVNAPRSPWCDLDVAALGALARQPSVIVVPKVEGAGDLEFIERLLDGVEARARRSTPVRVHALIETAAGLSRVNEIAGASQRLEALILGYADLSASLGRSEREGTNLDGWRFAQDAVLTAARTHGLYAIDGPFLGIGGGDEFLASVSRARDMGFDGKWAIHPSQLAAINEVFTPTAGEVKAARVVVAALAEAERGSGAGAVAVDGQMLDEAVRLAALRTLARAGVSA